MKDEELLARRLSTIQQIVIRCDDIGKTKIQKIAYFLQESVGVPLKCPFRMHYYGPYSDELDGVLSLAKSLGYIDIKPDPNGFGYHVTPGEEREDIWFQKYDMSQDANIEVIDGAIKTLGTLETSDLELYATIHFIGRQESKLSKNETLRTVGRLKPKFGKEQIDTAYQTLQKAKLI